jgi:exosortase D (VPLPA-CTERM-specific)
MTNNSTLKLNVEPAGLKGINLPAFLYSAICLTLFALLYTPTYAYMLTKWEFEDYNHCYLVPLIVLYLIWEKRDAFRDVALAPSWKGVVPVGMGVVLFWLGELGGEYYTLYLSSWLVLVGMVWIYTGWRKLKTVGFALCFLIAMFPFPGFINGNLTFKLKLISSQLGVFMLQFFGQSAYREGNVIDLGFTRLQVVDACSGLRFFLPLVILGILLAYYLRAAWWKRMLLILATLPLTVFTNSLRIASVGILYKFIGPRAADGFIHDFSGWFMFMVSLGMLLGLMWCLKRIFPEPARVDAAASLNPDLPTGIVSRRVSLLYSILLALPALVMLGGTAVIARNVDFREKVPMRRPFADFPVQAGEWLGTRQTMEKVYLDTLDLTDYVMVDFRNDSSNQQISFYVAYNDSQSKGKSSHSPATCLPGSGWEFKNPGATRVELSGGAAINVMRAVMEKNGQQQLVYYWFPQRGRVLHNLFELKLYVFWDALTMRRTDGALVRINTPVADPANPGEADARLQGFVKEILPVLDGYLGGKGLQAPPSSFIQSRY